jgi:hypothetical protein
MFRLPALSFLVGTAALLPGCSHAPPQDLLTKPETLLSYAAGDPQAEPNANQVCRELGGKAALVGTRANDDGTKTTTYKCE